MLDTLIVILIFLAVFAVLILSHEFGHFIAAKLSGVRVDEFGIGFPPRILKLKRGETLWSLNAVPLGGFVKLFGEDGDSAGPRSFASKSIPIRFSILFAGPLMNLLLPILLFSISFMVPHNTVLEQVVVQEVAPDSPAAVAGIVPGDTILQVNGHDINNRAELSYYLQLGLGSEVEILLQTPDLSQEEVSLVPRWNPPEGQGAIGVTVAGVDGQVVRQSYPPWQAIKLGVQSCGQTLVLFWNAIRSWIIGAAAPDVAGPVGIAQITGEVAKAGISPLLAFTAFISLNLAIINLLPLPALDGGRIVFLLVEFIRRGKKVSPRIEQRVNYVGFTLLIVLICVVTYFDIARIIVGESLLG